MENAEEIALKRTIPNINNDDNRCLPMYSLQTSLNEQDIRQGFQLIIKS